MNFMKQLLTLGLCALLATNAFAQEKGIHFEHGLSWKQILAKAKTENKLIMVDCYTTWCGPCKMMTKKTFTDEKVAAFYNKNFVNVKMQMDTAKNDTKETKERYADARLINSKYQIEAYPTILFLDADGKILDKAIGYREANDFVNSGKAALEPNERLSSLVAAFKKKPNDESIIGKLIPRIYDLDHETANMLLGKYIAMDGGKLTPEKLGFLLSNTNSTTDAGFKIIQEHAGEIDAQEGKGTAASVISQVIAKEELLPELQKNQATPDKINWTAIKAKLDKKYPQYTEQVIMLGKMNNIFMTMKLNSRTGMIERFIDEYDNKPDPVQFATLLNTFAYGMAQATDDIALLNKALTWSKRSISVAGLPDKEKAMYKDTYASLLYKTGKKPDAIKTETEVLTWAQKAGDIELQDIVKQTLAKMKKGQDLFQ